MERIAREVGTPCFVYSTATLQEHCSRIRSAFAPLLPSICFSVKSCSNLSVLRVLVEAGVGMDVVSGHELRRAMEAGCDPSRCVYAGVGKTDLEIEFALRSGIGLFNVESEQEFDAIAACAERLNIRCHGALRVNPDVDPKTHRYTSTGNRESKFGVDLERAADFIRKVHGNPWCSLRGIHLHIGSPIYSCEPYTQSILKALALIDALCADGIVLDTLDLGGGFGADYETGQSPSAADYASTIVPLLEERVRNGLRVILEPGRSIAANAGVLLVSVVYTKESGDRTFAICDAGMNALLRPSHYDAFHFIWPIDVSAAFVPPSRRAKLEMSGLKLHDIVGPLCETGDFLALERAIPPVNRHDRLAVFTAGAYGMTMASRYNSSALPAEVLVEGDTFRVVRLRECYDDLVAHERVGSERCAAAITEPQG